ncbi:MAG TPA: type II toxin-antitoxin system VapC family toxin, partial [Anaerolineae bacterium]|nr:type II toxin-antitoxin system VapC family toxin [Anaerolineae bacterium]
LHLRERPEITALLTRWGVEGALCISVVTRTEILAGMHPHEEERTMGLLDSLENLPVDEAIADRAGRLIYQYARQGVQLSFADTLIAATALHHNLILATTDPKHFPSPELQIYPLSFK